MAGPDSLEFEPEKPVLLQLPLIAEKLGQSGNDPLAPGAPIETGFSDFFNAQAGLMSGPSTDLGAYASLGWSGNQTLMEPPEGVDGAMRIFSFNSGVGAAADYDGTVIGFVHGDAIWTMGDSTWSPPTSETIESPDVVWDEALGDFRTVGTITETIDTPGAHNFEGNALEIAIRGYADTEGEYDANISATREFWGMDEDDFSLTGRAIAGINNDDGTYAGIGVIAIKPVTDNVSLYGEAQAYATDHNGLDGYVEAGVMGNIPLDLSIGPTTVESMPAQIGLQQDLNGGSPKIVGQVAVLQW